MRAQICTDTQNLERFSRLSGFDALLLLEVDVEILLGLCANDLLLELRLVGDIDNCLQWFAREVTPESRKRTLHGRRAYYRPQQRVLGIEASAVLGGGSRRDS